MPDPVAAGNYSGAELFNPGGTPAHWRGNSVLCQETTLVKPWPRVLKAGESLNSPVLVQLGALQGSAEPRRRLSGGRRVRNHLDAKWRRVYHCQSTCFSYITRISLFSPLFFLSLPARFPTFFFSDSQLTQHLPVVLQLPLSAEL